MSHSTSDRDPARGSASCSQENEQLSGYLDGVLTQGAAQRVRIHLDACVSCRAVVDEMRSNRLAAITTAFPTAPDNQWDETPRSWISRWSRNVGWGGLLVWLLVALALALWLPEGAADERLGRILIGGAVLAGAALFLSVALDRLKTSKSDIYRGVRK